MSEEILSEFTEELAKRKEPVPQDLIKKYKDRGLPESEIAAALLARSALSHPDVPQSAMENSARKIEELSRRSSAKQAKKPGLGDRLKKRLGR